MNPPKFKVGDMVMFQAAKLSDHFFNGRIGTVIKAPRFDARKQAWRCLTDVPRPPRGRAAVPVEYCLRLIKDGDLKLDDIPLAQKEPACAP